ncbi:hypothetical protein FRC12_020977 [Ceratobasidium sp. 428]|nr:hypothetical protein FRC12_020977 [Ceratobasidium sp. 428]
MAVFAYYDNNTDGIVYHVKPSSQSESEPSSFDSETDSVISGTTIESADLPGYFVLSHGRQQPASDNIVKWPADNLQLYIIRYHVLNCIFGGNYVGPVKEALAPTGGRRRQALELGTGPGTWVQAMATEFSHVQFRTVDVVPMVSHVPRHNIVFEVYDFTEGLLLEDQSQDVVFLNIVLEIVKDHRALLHETYRVLRPGGLIHVSGFHPHFWDWENISKPARRTNPRACHFVDLLHQHLSKIGIDSDRGEKLLQWLAPNSDLWDQAQSGFKNIESVVRTYPAYPHEGYPCMDQIDARISPYLRQLMIQFLKDTADLIKGSAVDHQEVEQLLEDTLEELSRHEGCTLAKVYCMHAIKV